MSYESGPVFLRIFLLLLHLPLVVSCVATSAVRKVPALEYYIWHSQKLENGRTLSIITEKGRLAGQVILAAEGEWDKRVTAEFDLPITKALSEELGQEVEVALPGQAPVRVKVMARYRYSDEYRRDWEWGTVKDLAVYPVTGLPRDLLDVPFTALNQLGMGSDGAIKDGQGGFVWPFMAAGAAVPIILLAPAAAGAPWVYAVMIPAGAAGALAGFTLGVWTNIAYWDVVRGAQTQLLRDGVESRVPYSGRVQLPDGIWTSYELQRYEAIRRAHAFFPIWRFKTNKNPIRLGESRDAAKGLWVLDEFIIY